MEYYTDFLDSECTISMIPAIYQHALWLFMHCCTLLIAFKQTVWFGAFGLVVEDAQLTQIKVVHDLHQELSLQGPHGTVLGTFNSIDCELFWSKTQFQLPTFFGADPNCILMPPCHSVALSSKLTTSVAAALVTQFTIDGQVVNIAEVHQYLCSHPIIKDWGQVCPIDSDKGDTMNSSTMVAIGDDLCDATNVHVSIIASSL